MSLFITFEGVEGSGKSTQAKTLYRHLHRLEIPVLLTHEPGVTPLGRKITHWLKWRRDVPISPVAELMLFNASRAELVATVIRPALAAGTVVICDRYTDSTLAYQGYGRGLDPETVRKVNEAAAQGLKPALTVLLDVASETGLARKIGQPADRFERETLAFHRRVRQGYQALAAAEPERWLVVDGRATRRRIAAAIRQKVEPLLPERKRR